jgi:putative ABC transport system substrate-binding protein
MNRRSVAAPLAAILLATIQFATAASAQQAARIGLLGSGEAQSSGIFVDGLKQGLREQGLVEGRDYTLDIRWAAGDYRQFPALAREIAEGQPKVILATTIAAVRAAQQAAGGIPVVMTSINDPVGARLVASLARPGGTTTGIANMTEDLTPKVLELVMAVLPKARNIATLLNPANPSNRPMLERIRRSPSLGGATVTVTEFKTVAGLDATLDGLAASRPDALIVINDATLIDLRERIAALALQNRIPAFSSIPEMTDGGGLASYGTPRVDLYRRSAYYVKKILDGAKPADLPVEQPTHVELAINLKTARTLGIALPDAFLARADRVVE